MSPLALTVLLPLVLGTLLCLWCGRSNTPSRRAGTALIAGAVTLAVLGTLLSLAGPVMDGQVLLTQAEWVPAIGLNANYRLDGLGLIRALAARALNIPVVLLTTFDDAAAFDDAVRAGARGFLLKAISPDTLLQALREVHAGGTALRPSLTTRMERPSATAERAFVATPEPDPLSPKELQVLRLVASGRSNTEIAMLLGNSEGVIKNHCSAVFSKMGVRDRTQAVLRAIDLGWI